MGVVVVDGSLRRSALIAGAACLAALLPWSVLDSALSQRVALPALGLVVFALALGPAQMESTWIAAIVCAVILGPVWLLAAVTPTQAERAAIEASASATRTVGD